MSPAGQSTTPMLEQYWRLKAQNPEALLFFRLGDFYELFDDDARIAAPILDLQLTSRDGRVAMCGVPYHAGTVHARRLLEQGFTVAVAEQVEEPSEARGLVDRQIVRVLTAGTIIPEDDEGTPRLAVLYRHRAGWVALMAELSTGRLRIAEAGTAAEDVQFIRQLWGTWAPHECLSNTDEGWIEGARQVEGAAFFKRAHPAESRRLVADRLGIKSLRRWGIDDRPGVDVALAALARYLSHVYPRLVHHLHDVEMVLPTRFMRCGLRTLMQLDVAASTASLFHQVDYTATKMGGRRLREWLEHPLTDRDLIAARLAAVGYWVDRAVLRDRVREVLTAIGDLSRRVSRVAMTGGTPRDVAAIAQGLERAPDLMAGETTVCWQQPTGVTVKAIHELHAVLAVLESSAPSKWDEGPLIRDGVDPEVDAMRGLVENHRAALMDLEESERRRSGIKTVRVGFHRTFGYYLEVTKSQAKNVPDDWHRRQTTTHAERFVSEALKDLETAIMQAQARLKQREQSWAQRLQDAVREASGWLVELASWLADVDALASLAEAAVRHGYREPEFSDVDGPVEILGLRHPVVEQVVGDYVKSDLTLASRHHVLIVTGPNMGGKSTFMRALAQNVVLAQVGGWVAADRYRAPIFDALLTRIGADDDLVRGQSTFMVEMEEVAAILQQATGHSLVLLDELGRGTSTYDGMAVAHAVIERLAFVDGPLTLCATHYHELTELADTNPHVGNLTVEVLDGVDGPVFTHRVIPGAASQSYGIEVARKAGLPSSVIRRAQSHLKRWEGRDRRAESLARETSQLTFDNPDPLGGELIRALQSLSPDDVSPREAWLWLAEWKRRAEGRQE